MPMKQPKHAYPWFGRDLGVDALIYAAACMNDRFFRCDAAPDLMRWQHISCCKRVQWDFGTLAMGSKLTSDAIGLPSLGRTAAARTLPPLPFRVFADAASARKCGVAVAAKQHVTSIRPLKVSPRNQIQSTFSRQPGSTNEERDSAAVCLYSFR